MKTIDLAKFAIDYENAKDSFEQRRYGRIFRNIMFYVVNGAEPSPGWVELFDIFKKFPSLTRSEGFYVLKIINSLFERGEFVEKAKELLALEALREYVLEFKEEPVLKQELAKLTKFINY